MDSKEIEKTVKSSSKSFMTVGPTLHYSHKNVLRCWLLALAVFSLSCIFWSKINTGSYWSFSPGKLLDGGIQLGRYVVNGVSIFEYPWQVLVLGVLMGIMAIVPVLVAQLMSFMYSLFFLLAVFLLAGLPGLAVCLLFSCLAVACRPLRFRSRFTAIALCTAPQLIYWSYFGGVKTADAIEFGFTFTPWICAWLAGLAMAGLVLGIGHFTRYRPGLIWIITLTALAAAVLGFDYKIGFDELDYQLYIAGNNPDNVNEFRDHHITEALDETMKDPVVQEYLLAGLFYPTDPITLRIELKKKIKHQLSVGDWPVWFRLSEELDYQKKKNQLNRQYDLFITRRLDSRRMPIALYYKAMLSEYSPDLRILEKKEILSFYNDYPFESSRSIWFRLYNDFGDSPESIEARWRIARHLAGQGSFDEADRLLREAQRMSRQLMLYFSNKSSSDTVKSRIFRSPEKTAITRSKLIDLRHRINQLRSLISAENRVFPAKDKKTRQEAERRLAQFVMFNPYDQGFVRELDSLLSQIDSDDSLRDNILLARTKLISDEQLRAEKLHRLYKEFPSTDGGEQAIYDLALLKIKLWQRSDSNPEQKKKYLSQARVLLEEFIRNHPDSIFASQAGKNLADLPEVD